MNDVCANLLLTLFFHTYVLLFLLTASLTVHPKVITVCVFVICLCVCHQYLLFYLTHWDGSVDPSSHSSLDGPQVWPALECVERDGLGM